VLTDINADRLEEVAASLCGKGGKVTAMASDVTKEDSMGQLADAVFAQFGNVHLLFNNAGSSIGDARGPLWRLPMKDWNFGFDLHVMGIVHGLKAFLPRMIENGEEGCVVNTTSETGGLVPRVRSPIYSASKAALTSLTEVLCMQMLTEAPQIGVGLLFPGPSLVRTGLMSPVRPAEYVDANDPPPPGIAMETLAVQMGDMPITEPHEVADFALECIEKDRFWMIHPEFDIEPFAQRCKDIVARRNPVLPEA
jgi:NAD(P)-dependent dehydrogenase (short-subunit alcohol dehydrogenase family)